MLLCFNIFDEKGFRFVENKGHCIMPHTYITCHIYLQFNKERYYYIILYIMLLRLRVLNVVYFTFMLLVLLLMRVMYKYHIMLQ